MFLTRSSVFCKDSEIAPCFFHKDDNCTSPEVPPNAEELQCLPAKYEKYKQCSLICKNNMAPSIPSPRIHTCGPVGNWDPENKFVPYRITPCGGNLHSDLMTSNNLMSPFILI